MEILQVSELSKTFGGLRAVWNISFALGKGEILGLIGPNGAGKTTVFNLITGLYKPTRGRIVLRGDEIQGLSSNAVNRKGIARTFQNIRLFKKMSVLENVYVGMHTKYEYTLVEAVLRTKRYRGAEERHKVGAKELLSFVNLDGKGEVVAENLSYGDQRKLELARALASDPEIILLDEPTAGMNPQEANEIISMIRSIQNRGFSILLVEHNMKVVMNASDRIVVMDAGVKIAEGKPQEVQKNSDVIKAYLGVA